jgi:hypothetical protein
MQRAMGTALAFACVAFACNDNENATLCKSNTDCGTGTCTIAPVSRLAYCADVAPGCATGFRWASTAGDELAGQCVAPEVSVDAGVDAEVTP